MERITYERPGFHARTVELRSVEVETDHWIAGFEPSSGKWLVLDKDYILGRHTVEAVTA